MKKKIKGIEVDIRGKGNIKNRAIYITIGNWIVYIDNSTNEKIITSWDKKKGGKYA
jgi:hypothetical protein